MTKREEALQKALERIADFDASEQNGYVDEWEEAAAFVRCRQIARDALQRES